MGSVFQTFPSLTAWEQVRLCAFPPSSLSEDATFLCGASIPDDTAAHALSGAASERPENAVAHSTFLQAPEIVQALLDNPHLLVCVDHIKSSMMIMKKNLNFLPCSSGIALVSPCPHQSHNQLLDLFDI